MWLQGGITCTLADTVAHWTEGKSEETKQGSEKNK